MAQHNIVNQNVGNFNNPYYNNDQELYEMNKDYMNEKQGREINLENKLLDHEENNPNNSPYQGRINNLTNKNYSNLEDSGLYYEEAKHNYENHPGYNENNYTENDSVYKEEYSPKKVNFHNNQDLMNNTMPLNINNNDDLGRPKINLTMNKANQSVFLSKNQNNLNNPDISRQNVPVNNLNMSEVNLKTQKGDISMMSNFERNDDVLNINDYLAKNNSQIDLNKTNNLPKSKELIMKDFQNYNIQNFNEYDYINNNFKNLIETEQNKSFLETRQRNDTNFFDYIQPDNSKLNISNFSYNVNENAKNYETDGRDILINPKHAKNALSNINKTVNYGDKINTIFDENKQDNSFTNYNNVTTNFNKKRSTPLVLNNTNMNNSQIYNQNASFFMNQNPNKNNNNYYNNNYYKISQDTQINDLDITLAIDLNTKRDLQEEPLIEPVIVPVIEPVIEEINISNHEEMVFHAKVEDSLILNEPEVVEIIQEEVQEEKPVEIENSNIQLIIEPEPECEIFEKSIMEVDKSKYNYVEKIEFENSDHSKYLNFPEKLSLCDVFTRSFVISTYDKSPEVVKNIHSSLIANRYFSSYILKEKNLIDSVGNKVKIDHFESLKVSENLIKVKLKENVQSLFIMEISDIIESKDYGNNKNNLSKENLLEEMKKKFTKSTFNKISCVYETQDLFKKYNISEEKLIIGKNIKIKNNSDNKMKKTITFNNNPEISDQEETIEFWRDSLCDGNSFYRMFMFAFIEYNILNKNTELLAKTFMSIVEICNNISQNNKDRDISNEKYILSNIDIHGVTNILNLILNFMRLEDYFSAYKLLYIAFNLEDISFDKVFNYINFKFLLVNDCLFKTECVR